MRKFHEIIQVAAVFDSICILMELSYGVYDDFEMAGFAAMILCDLLPSEKVGQFKVGLVYFRAKAGRYSELSPRYLGQQEVRFHDISQ